MFSNSLELSIEVDGKRIPEFGHRGKTYVEGRPGKNFFIKFRNSRAERVLVIPSVDGLSAIDGKSASQTSSGYVVQAYSSLTIPGWRTSLNEVRDFEFVSKGGSYAGKTAGEQNCGVIGCVIFNEKAKILSIVEHHIHHYPAPSTWIQPCPRPISTTTRLYGAVSGEYACDLVEKSLQDETPIFMGNFSLAGDCAQPMGTAPDFNLGTAFGNARQDTVREATFDKGIILVTMELYYSDRDGLLKAGIPVDKTPEIAVFPQAFNGFCQPPAR